jgi:hypothetical protein
MRIQVSGITTTHRAKVAKHDDADGIIRRHNGREGIAEYLETKLAGFSI